MSAYRREVKARAQRAQRVAWGVARMVARMVKGWWSVDRRGARGRRKRRGEVIFFWFLGGVCLAGIVGKGVDVLFFFGEMRGVEGRDFGFVEGGGWIGGNGGCCVIYMGFCGGGGGRGPGIGSICSWCLGMLLP